MLATLAREVDQLPLGAIAVARFSPQSFGLALLAI